MDPGRFERKTEFCWAMPPTGSMRVPALLFADRQLIAEMDDKVGEQLANVASLPITLYPGMKIGQVSFMQMTTPAEHPYGSGAKGSKYQGQRGPTPSRYFENFG